MDWKRDREALWAFEPASFEPSILGFRVPPTRGPRTPRGKIGGNKPGQLRKYVGAEIADAILENMDDGNGGEMSKAGPGGTPGATGGVSPK